MITIGQYVRAILAEGIAAALPSTEGFEAQLEREGLVVQIRPAQQTFVLEDFFGNEHICHLTGAVAVELTTLDSYLHSWAMQRGSELVQEAS